MAYRDSTSGNGSGATSFNLTVPAVAENDIVLAFVSQDTSANPTLDITGFAPLGSVSFAAATPDGQKMQLFWRRASISEGVNYSGTSTISDAASGIGWWVSTWSGRNTLLPPVMGTFTQNTTANPQPTVTVTAPAVTAVRGDDIAYVAALDVTAINVGNGGSPPTNFTQKVNGIDLGSGWVNIYLAIQDNVGAGSTGSAVGTFSLSSDFAGWWAGLVRLPAPIDERMFVPIQQRMQC